MLLLGGWVVVSCGDLLLEGSQDPTWVMVTVASKGDPPKLEHLQVANAVSMKLTTMLATRAGMPETKTVSSPDSKRLRSTWRREGEAFQDDLI